MAKSFKVVGTGRVVTGEEDTYKPKSFKVVGTGEVFNGTGTKIQTQSQSQSNNPPSVKAPGGNALDIAKQAIANQKAPAQMGVGFTPIPQNPYAKKVSALPYNPAALQKAQTIAQQAQGKTAQQLRQQNLANIKRVGDEMAYDTTKKLQDFFEKPVQPKSVLGANMWAGLGQFNKSLAQTADFILPDVITPKVVQQGIDSYKRTAEAQAQHAANINAEKGVSDFAGQMIQGTVAAVPNAILALMSGGASLGAQTIGQTSTGLVGSVGSALKELAKNPMFYSSLVQTAGPEYEQAKANGATELEATLTAIISSIVNSGIEIGGGIEAVAKNPISLKNWVKGMLDEGKEEVLQGIISQAAAKATYDKDKAWVSATDENAVINPGRMAQEFAGGAVVGGVLGGGQMLAGRALGMPTEQDSYLPQRGENATAAELAGRLDINDPQPGKLPTVTRREQRALDALSAKTGVNIQIDDDIKGSNGYFDRKTNTLHISRNSNNAVYQVAAHEITHSFESNPAEWNQLYEIANANLSEDARSKLEYVLQKTGYTDAEMQSEVVSHYVQQCVTDIKSFEQLVGVNRTLAQRIVDAFESFVRKLTGQQNIGNDSDTEYLREIMGDITPEQAQQTLAQMKKALATSGQATGEGSQNSVKLLPDNTLYIQMETNLFTNEDGSPMTDREIYNSIVGTTIVFPDGMTATIEKRLPGNKEMYDELFKRRLATGEGTERDKQLNSLINQNFLEIAENAEGVLYGEPDRNQRHLKNGIAAFDTRAVSLYDGNYAYDLELSIATLMDGRGVAYAKRHITRNQALENKIKQAGTAGQSPKNQPVTGQALTNQAPSNSQYTQNSNPVNNQNSLKLTDSDGNKLTEEQQEYFKDSKMRDDNGNLKVMYHGTNTPNFTVFDSQFSDDKISLFFTDSPNVADSYTTVQSGGRNLDPYRLPNTIKTLEEYNQYMESVGEDSRIVQVTDELIEKARQDVEAAIREDKRNDFYRNRINELMGLKGKYIHYNGGLRYITRSDMAFDTAEELIEKDVTDKYWVTHRFGSRYAVYLNLSNPYVMDAGKYYRGVGTVEIENGFEDTTAIITLGDDELVVKRGYGESYEDFANRFLSPPDAKKFLQMVEGEREKFIQEEAELGEQTREEVIAFWEKHGGIRIGDFAYKADNVNIDYTEPGVWNDLYGADISEYYDWDEEWPFKTRDVAQYAKENGYDGVIFKNLKDIGGYSGGAVTEASTIAIAFDSNQIKSVANKNPTSDEDIRFSRKLNREALQEMAERSRTGIPYAPGYAPKEARKPALPYNPNTTDWYENRVNELRWSIKDLGRNRRKKVDGYSVGMYTRNGSDDITISIKTPDGDIIRDFVKGGEYWTNSQLQHEIASRIAEAEGYSAEEKQPAQGKFGEPMGIVANPEAVARAQERREFFQPKPNPEGSRNIEGSVLDNLGQGEAAFATLDNLLAQSKLDAAKKPDAKEGIANVLTERPKKGVKENIEIAADFAARKLIDSGRTIDTIGKAVDDKVLYPLYNNAKQSRQAAEYMIGDAQTDINGKRVGDSLVSIFDPIKSKGEDYFRDFSTYLYHVHNVDRMSLETNGAQVYQDAIMQLEMENPMLQNATREEVEAIASGNSDYREASIEWLQLDDSLNDLHNKPVFGESVTAEDSRKAAAELARKNPEFAELAEKVYTYNRNLMKYRVDAGLVSQKQADIMNALYPHYVPTFRDTSSTTGMKMGGNQAQVARTVRSASGSNLDLMPIDGSMAEQTLQTVRAAKMNIFGARLLEDALKHQDKVGRHIRSVVDRYNSYDMDEPPQYTGGITIYSAGKPVSMDADVGVMEAFKSIQPDPLEGSNIYRRIVDANNTFKALVTGANPMFLAKNFARDLQDAGLYAGDLKDFAKNYPKAWKEIKNNGELWQLYKSQGGTGSSYFDYEKGLVDNKRKGVGKVFDKVEAANMMVEQAPRFAEFMSVLEKEGRTYEGIQKAMLAAADITVNFGRSGTLTKTLNKTFVPFLNPSVQGADKFVRRFAQTKGAKEWFDLIGRCALLGIVPGLLNELLHRGTEEEEEYEMLNDRDKETNYVFSIGDGVWVKIPRGRAVSIFGSAAQRTARMAKGDEDAWAGFIELALDQVGSADPFTGHILSSYLNTELFNPESPGKTWYGGDIEPQRLQGLPPGERYDEKTDNLSKWLGKQLNISPKKINHLLDSYTGVIGDFALPLMTPRAERNPFAAAFSIDSTTSNKLQGEFYDKLDELEQNKNSANPDAGTDLAYSYLNGVSREVSELNKQIRAIEADETIKDKDKREQTRKLAEERNNLIKEALEELPSYQEAAAGYKGDPDDAKREVNRKQFGAEYALKKYNKEVYENAQKANKYLIPYETFYDVYFAQKDLKSDKDSDGKTIKNSLSKKKKAAIDKTAKSLTQKQKEYLYDMFGVSKSEWNKLPTRT